MVKFFCDASSRIENGERRGFIGIVGYRNGKVIAKHAVCVGLATNHEAAYYAVIGALVIAKRLGVQCTEINSSSQLVVGQLTGAYTIDSKRLAKLADTFQTLAEQLDRVTVEHGKDTRAYRLAQSSDRVEFIDPSAKPK